LEGLSTLRAFPRLLTFLDPGVDRARVRAILGENFVRALELAEKVAW
jgi:hypothetical protein